MAVHDPRSWRPAMDSLPRSDWMAALDGQRGLWELTIPGTHDSGARHGGLRAVTQTLDILGQLHAGIRFFDLRLKRDGGVLRVYHGDVDQRAELEADVVTPMLGFFEHHSREAVVLSIKNEGKSEGDAALFARDLESCVRRYAASFYVAPAFPRLDDACGRIVVIRRFARGEIGIPAPPERWGRNTAFEIATPGGALVVEDGWDLRAWRLGRKWTAVARNLDAAARSPKGWYITFTSATSDFIWPRAIAGGVPPVEGMNQRLLDYVAQHPVGAGRLGTVVMDFPELPDERLIQSLIDVNR